MQLQETVIKTIGYKDLQYARERLYFSKLRELYAEITRSGLIQEKIHNKEYEFYDLLSKAVRVDRHHQVAESINAINEHLSTNFKINVFLHQSPLPNALCTSKLNYNNLEEDAELIVLVTQHYFNDLDSKEQICILGHEIAHMVFGHVQIPTNLLLNEAFKLENVKDFKFSLLKWSLCCEITSDIFGFVACRFDEITYCNAMLKYTSGLSTLEDDIMQKLVLQQYEDIAEALYEGELASHPLTPLRIKLIHTIKNTELVKSFGKKVDEHQRELMLAEFNNTIDAVVRNIYPEIISDNLFKGYDLQFELSVAIALADGEVTKPEFEALELISEATYEAGAYMKDLNRLLDFQTVEEVIDSIIKRCTDKAIRARYTKIDLVPLMRQLLIVAASDGNIETEELKTIHRFGKNFGFTKHDIIILLGGLKV